MENNIFRTLLTSYKKHVRAVVLPKNSTELKDIAYWRNEIFCNILTWFVPVSLVALIPGVMMAFLHKIILVAVADLIAFFVILSLIVNRRIGLKARKLIFICIIYLLSITLLLMIGKSGPGLLYLLTLTILSSIIYSSAAAYYSAATNTIICAACAVMIYAGTDLQIVDNYSVSLWLTISSNLVLLSVICAVGMNMLIKGMENTIRDKNTSESNLTSIIENTNDHIYSLDKDLRYIRFNKVLKNSIKETYNVDIKAGLRILDLLEISQPEEARLWENTYREALTGKTLHFEKEYVFGDAHATIAFSINPIAENGEITGVSCFAADITEFRDSQKKLLFQNDELIKTNTELDRFVYSVSHDLRAPLSSMLGIIQLSLDFNGDELMQKHLTILKGNVNKLDGFIGDILDYSRNARVKITNEQIFFGEMLNDISSNLKYMGGSNRLVDIIIELNDNTPVFSDKSRLNLILNNLISNSIRYQNQEIENPFVKVQTESSGNKTTLTISDNGMGIKKEFHEKIFDMFYRVSESSVGSGLGLYIVNEAVMKIGGKLQLQSEVGLGSTFIITIPNN